MFLNNRCKCCSVRPFGDAVGAGKNVAHGLGRLGVGHPHDVVDLALEDGQPAYFTRCAVGVRLLSPLKKVSVKMKLKSVFSCFFRTVDDAKIALSNI